jgi:hypothetical protein
MSPSTGSENVSDSERLTALAEEIDALVIRGAETTRFEFTVQCSLAGTDRKSQVDFAKTLQGMANSLPPEDRVYVIGADQKNKRFTNVENAREFDTANIGQILGKYLEPIPNFVSYPIAAKSGLTYIAVLLPSEQPRPIVAKVSMQDSDGKTYLLRLGEIWVKKNTALCQATRSDLEAMYGTRIETEAERRAQQRYATTRDVMEATFRIQSSPERQTPTEDLVLGPDANYEAYLEQVIAANDGLRFRMLLTVLRRCLIERWHAFSAYGWYSPEPSTPGNEKVAEHYKDVFQPSLRRLLHVGLLLLEHNINSMWFRPVTKLLVESFSASRQLQGLSEDSRKSIATEIVIAGRLLASYAARMNRFECLPDLLKEVVTPVGRGTGPGTRTEPFVFWPVRRNAPRSDRIAYAWEYHVQPYWLRFFGSQKSFVDAACQLEFINELNSHVGVQVPEAKEWVNQHYPGLDMTYWCELWRYPLQSCVSLAEQIYDGLGIGPDWPFILNISVIHGAFQKAFPNEVSREQRKEIFLKWLREFLEWHAKEANNHDFFFQDTEWGPLLGPKL